MRASLTRQELRDELDRALQHYATREYVWRVVIPVTTAVVGFAGAMIGLGVTISSAGGS